LGTILIVDDDPVLRESFKRLLGGEGHEVMTSATGEAALEIVASRRTDLVIMDVRLPGVSGLEAFLEMKKIDPKIPVIVMTAFGTTETAIEATKMGAFDYVLKPFDIPEMLSLIDKALESGRFMREKVEVDPSCSPWPSTEALVGRSRAMQEVYKAIGRVAATDATVLIRGESGTGKELVARAIYQHSSRADKAFLVINCVAIPETLLESELFGYQRGAFTGATAPKPGKFEVCDGGTIF
jgi:two-component system nitrogen regulation response regulator GlnG